MSADSDGSVLTLRADLAAELDELAVRRGMARDDLANESVERYLAYERWVSGRIEHGLRQADAGDFASDLEVERVFGKYQAHDRDP